MIYSLLEYLGSLQMNIFSATPWQSGMEGRERLLCCTRENGIAPKHNIDKLGTRINPLLEMTTHESYSLPYITLSVMATSQSVLFCNPLLLVGSGFKSMFRWLSLSVWWIKFNSDCKQKSSLESGHAGPCYLEECDKLLTQVTKSNWTREELSTYTAILVKPYNGFQWMIVGGL